jgi:4-amino-4-deoxy-L-arabinose transferase-like glycosyltransferase
MESRQTQTAEISRNLITDSFNIFLPRVDRYGPDNVYVVLEFPLFNLITALSAELTGFPIEPIGKFYSAVFGIFGAGIWFFLLKRHYPTRAVFVGMIFYLFTFIGIITARSFQPDTFALFWYLWVLLELDTCYSKNDFESSRWRLIILVSLACLTKSHMAILLVVPLIAYLWQRHSSKEIELIKAISFLLICFAPVVLWTVYGGWVHSKFPNPITSNYQIGNWFRPELFFSTENFNYYSSIWMQFRYSFLTGRSEALDWIIGIILLISFVKLFKDVEKRYFFLPILSSLAIYYFFFNVHTATHFYYHLPLLPLLAAGIAHLTAKLPRVPFFGILAALFTVSLVNVSTAQVYIRTNESQNKLIECADIVKKVVPQNGLLLTSYNEQTGLLYYSQRIGWLFYMERDLYKKHYKLFFDTTSFETDHIEAMQDFLEEGAEYYANCEPDTLQKYSKFRQYLIENFETVYSDPEKLFIFKLK